MFKVILGVTGGIAAYKTPEIVRLLTKRGCDVRVVLSKGAHSFVTPMTLQAVSGNPVYSEILDTDFENAMGHIELARWADNILIAPLSANRLAALAMGFCDDLLTTLCLATTASITVAPAMNRIMWEHPATQQHIQTLKARGIRILGPELGEQACGEYGLGRMQEPEDIVNNLLSINSNGTSPLTNRSIVITAGPTQEYIDPVRYISNRSSGKMGFALAQAAHALGAKVTLITGPVHLETPNGIKRINVDTAQAMLNAVIANISNCDIFISASAVADFRPQEALDQKMKKGTLEFPYHLSLIPNPDILGTVASLAHKPYCVGFAAETQTLIENAQKKLHDKQLDLIAVNDVSRADIGFDAQDNALTVLSAQKNYIIEKNTKYNVALQLLEIIGENFHAKN